MMQLPTSAELRLIDEYLKCKSEDRKSEIVKLINEICEYKEKYGLEAAEDKYKE